MRITINPIVITIGVYIFFNKKNTQVIKNVGFINADGNHNCKLLRFKILNI